MIAITLTKDGSVLSTYTYGCDEYSEAYELIKSKLELSGELQYEPEGSEVFYNAFCDGIEFTYEYLDETLQLVYKAN